MSTLSCPVPASRPAPRRCTTVVHVIESLDNGAVENWLLRMIAMSRDQGAPLRWILYSTLPREGRFDSLARDLGATVVHSPYELRHTVSFMRHMRAVLRESGADILHCHHDVMSAVYLAATAGLSLRRRIVHVHNADLEVPTASRWRAGLLRELMRHMCLIMADRIVGISEHTLAHFTKDRDRSARDVVLYYGVDTLQFRESSNATMLRDRLGLHPSQRILLFVGRMVAYKNPLYVLDVLEELTASHPETVAVFAGEGSLCEEVGRQAAVRGLAERTRVLGWRDDSAALMAAADVFLFPRAERRIEGIGPEGLGLTVVEAQAAGLPSLFTRAIPADAVVVPELCHIRGLNDGPREWAATVGAILDSPKPDREAALRTVAASRFSLACGFEQLAALYG